MDFYMDVAKKDCLVCGKTYCCKELIRELKGACPDFDDSRPTDEEIVTQLEMKRCGECRVQVELRGKHETKLCANCLWYGQNHPLAVDGQCLNCRRVT